MNNAIFCQLNMRRNCTCQSGASRMPAGCCALAGQRTRGLFIERTENTRTIVAASTSPFSAGTCAGRQWLLLFSCYWVVALSHTPGCVYTWPFPALGGVFVCCLCLLVAHTYQAILVLLPKFTNAPTKVNTGCLAHWGSRV